MDTQWNFVTVTGNKPKIQHRQAPKEWQVYCGKVTYKEEKKETNHKNSQEVQRSVINNAYVQPFLAANNNQNYYYCAPPTYNNYYCNNLRYEIENSYNNNNMNSNYGECHTGSSALVSSLNGSNNSSCESMFCPLYSTDL